MPYECLQFWSVWAPAPTLSHHITHQAKDHTNRDTQPNNELLISAVSFFLGGICFFSLVEIETNIQYSCRKDSILIYIYIVYTHKVQNDTRFGLQNTLTIHMITSDMCFFLERRTPKNMYEFLASLPLGLNKFQPTFQCSAHHQAVCFLGGRSTVEPDHGQ